MTSWYAKYMLHWVNVKLEKANFPEKNNLFWYTVAISTEIRLQTWHYPGECCKCLRTEDWWGVVINSGDFLLCQSWSYGKFTIVIGWGTGKICLMYCGHWLHVMLVNFLKPAVRLLIKTYSQIKWRAENQWFPTVQLPSCYLLFWLEQMGPRAF